MAKTMKWAAGIFLALTLVLAVSYRFFPAGVLLTLAITAGTISYHLCMRLLVGRAFHVLLKNRANYHRSWYRLHNWEKRLYEKLRIKKWKAHLPTFQPELFDPRLHTWEEIAQAMCQAELVHETIIVLSFLPLAFVPLFGSFPAFLLTSLGSAAFDGLFVMLQRYNRPRVIHLIEREKSS